MYSFVSVLYVNVFARERQKDDTLLKEGSRFHVHGMHVCVCGCGVCECFCTGKMKYTHTYANAGEDGYAFGRHAVSAMNVIEELSNQELRHQLMLPHWGLDKKAIPRKRYCLCVCVYRCCVHMRMYHTHTYIHIHKCSDRSGKNFWRSWSEMN